MSEKVKNISDEDKAHLKKLGVPNDIISRLREPNHEQARYLRELFERRSKWHGLSSHQLKRQYVDLSYLIIRHPDAKIRQQYLNCSKLIFPQINFSGSVFGAQTKPSMGRKAVYTSSFSSAEFKEDAEFYGAYFLGSASFRGAKFQGAVNFNKAIFNSSADFSRAEFNHPTFFNETMFEEIAIFTKSVFNGENNFHDTLFEGQSYFSEATFNNVFSCSRMTCIELSEFDMAHFNSTVAFDNVRWGTLPSFRNTSFQQKPSSEYMDGILDLLNGRVTARKLKLLNSLYRHEKVTRETLYILRDMFDEGDVSDYQLAEIRNWVEQKKDYAYRDELLCILQNGHFNKLNNFVKRRASEETSLRKYRAAKAPVLGGEAHENGIERVPANKPIPLSDKVWKEDTEAPDKIRFFRLLCNEAGDHYREHQYFSLEMKAHSHHRETGYMLKGLYWLYGAMSEYGYSVTRPLLIWLSFSTYFWVLFTASGIVDECKKNIDLWDTLPFYLGNLLPFFGSSYTARKSLECSGGIHPITFEGHMITLANSGISMLCIFLLFLALRNRFRL